MEIVKPTYDDLVKQLESTRWALDEANETIEAIRTGQVDALIVHGENGHELYTLKTADQTYRVFIEKMNEGAVTLDKNGLILYSNSQFATMAGAPLSMVVGMPFERFVTDDCKETFAELLRKGWTEDCKGELILTDDGLPVPVQLSLTTLQLDEGVSLSIILTDLTAQKKAQKQLEEKNEELEIANRALEFSNHDLQQFASIASHDLQEPLRKILVFSSLLKANEQDNLTGESVVYLEKILASSKRMKQLIVDVLAYTRLSADRNIYEKTDLNEIVVELIEDYEIMISLKQATINTGNLPVIEANRGLIRQVFQNLLSNALKFTDDIKRPIVNISACLVVEKRVDAPEAPDGQFCKITLQDNGIGFDEKYADTVFSLFERLNAKSEYEGSGIGLSIAKKIVEKHDGIISVQSTEGVGTTFTIILPVSKQV